MITVAETVALGLRLRSHPPAQWAGMGIAPTPEQHRELVQLRAFLERFQSNFLVRAASPEERAKLETFAQAFAPREDLFRDKYVADRIAGHVVAFLRVTTPPQMSWLESKMRSGGVY